ncbi:response regulator transcription factor [bacterium]|nr:response regulator transcription factor [bacterium]
MESVGVSTRKKVMVVDDHPIIRHGIIQLINQENDLTVCGQGGDIRSALEAIRHHYPDVVLVDISLKGGSGLDLIKEMREQFPGLPSLVVSMHDESVYAERALRAGAKGYIMKQEATDSMINAIRMVLKGDVYLSGRLKEKLIDKMIDGREFDGPNPVEKLSDRELEIFRMIGQGMGTRSIADHLRLSVKTVEAHRAHIKDKLNLKSANELVHQAILWVEGSHT